MDYVTKENIDPTTGKNIAQPFVEVAQGDYVLKENVDPITGKLIAQPVVNVGASSGGTEVDPIWVADKPNYCTVIQLEELSEYAQVTDSNIHQDLVERRSPNIVVEQGLDIKYPPLPWEPGFDLANPVTLSVPGLELKADLDYVNSNFTNLGAALTEKQDILIAGENITIDPDTNTISSTGGGSGTDTKLSIDPLKTKWDGTNKNLVLSNTDDTKITIPMDTLVDFSEYSNNNTVLNNAIKKANVKSVSANASSGILTLTKEDNSTVICDLRDVINAEIQLYDMDVVVPRYANGLSRYLSTATTFTNNSDINLISTLVGDPLIADIETTVVGSGIDALLKLPALPYRQNYIITVTIQGNVSSGTGSMSDEVIFELYSGTKLLRAMEVYRNPLARNAREITFHTYTSGATDPMITSGLKIVAKNRAGNDITNCIFDMRLSKY